MAPPSNSRPVRLLLLMLAVVVGLAAWAFWPGTEHSVKLGLDLQGGTQIILQPRPVTEGTEITTEQLDQTVNILRQRVDSTGVVEAEITTQGSGSGGVIVVSVPGASQERLVELVQTTALLDFRPVWGIYNPGSSVTATPTPSASPEASAGPSASESADASADESPSPSAEPTASAAATPSPAPSPSASAADSADGRAPLVQAAENTPEFQEQVAALNCLDPDNFAGGRPDDPELWLGTCQDDGSAKFNLEPAFIRGTNVTSAAAVLPQNGIGWVVSLEFDSEGAAALAEASTRLTTLPECGQLGANPCNAFAIVLDGVVMSSPRFNEAILGGQAQIEGGFTQQEAKDLANVLKYGALPVTLEPVDITTVSPTVGSDQLRAGIIAGIIGLILVTIFLLLYYRALGLAAVASLLVAGSVVYMTFVVLSKTISLTLTLAGVAGAIIAIGITADSFIIYFERIRDELRDGRSLRVACETGWVRARRTRLAAQFVSLLAGVVLYILSVGNVRGFAFVLALTAVIDIIVAFWFTHPLVVLMGRSRWLQKGSWLSGLDIKVATRQAPVPAGRKEEPR